MYWFNQDSTIFQTFSKEMLWYWKHDFMILTHFHYERYAYLTDRLFSQEGKEAYLQCTPEQQRKLIIERIDQELWAREESELAA